MFSLELTNDEVYALLKAVNECKAGIRDKTSRYAVPKLSPIEKNFSMACYEHLDRSHTKALDLVQSEMFTAGE
jgi:hypothetical protein